MRMYAHSDHVLWKRKVQSHRADIQVYSLWFFGSAVVIMTIKFVSQLWVYRNLRLTRDSMIQCNFYMPSSGSSKWSKAIMEAHISPNRSFIIGIFWSVVIFLRLVLMALYTQLMISMKKILKILEFKFFWEQPRFSHIISIPSSITKWLWEILKKCFGPI